MLDIQLARTSLPPAVLLLCLLRRLVDRYSSRSCFPSSQLTRDFRAYHPYLRARPAVDCGVKGLGETQLTVDCYGRYLVTFLPVMSDRRFGEVGRVNSKRLGARTRV